MRRTTGILLIDNTNADRSAVRQLRLCLLRLHQEQEVLRRVLQLIIDGTIPFEPHTPGGDKLESYLNRATRVIFQENRHGIDQSAVRDVTALYDMAVSREERDLLLEQLHDARRQVAVKVARFTQQAARKPEYVYVAIDGGFHIGELTVEKQLTNTKISFGAGNTFHGDVVAAANIEKSFNKAAEATDNRLQDALKTLTVEVGKLTEMLTDGTQQQTVSRRLNQFVEEAASPQPDKSVLQVTGAGLMDAAKTVAEMTPIIMTSVNGVLSLFGVSV